VATLQPAETPAPTDVVDPTAGKIDFGTHYDSTTLVIDRGSATFARTVSKICWSAVFSNEATHSTVREILLRLGTGGVETQLQRWNQDISNPSFTVWANCENWRYYTGSRAGSYVLRFLDGVKILAEGKFKLK
jgi:hypothetical protein